VFYSAGYANDHWFLVVYNQKYFSRDLYSIEKEMTLTDKPLPFSIDDILKYEKSKSSIYSSILPRSYQLSSLLPPTYLSFSTAHKHSCSGKMKFQEKKF
jgi:hypothetical protein